MKFLIVLLTVWLDIASAAEPQRNLGIAPASGEKRVALVIGNSAYKDAPLKNPVNDAKDMAATLRRLGFDVIEKTNVSQKDINRAIAQFGEKLRADTVALFFYAGHGMQVKGKNYIIPIDAHITGEATVRAEAVDVDTVMDQLAISPMNIVILDACRNNPFERRFRSTSGGLAQMDAPKGSLIAYATAPGKTAADGDRRNGLYTQELLKHIQTPGLPLEAVFKRVRNGVMAASGEAQTPWEASSLTGEFFFRPVAGVASAAAQHVAAPVDLTAVEVSFWESIKSSTEPEDYQAYLDKYPSGQFVALAQRRVKKKPVKGDEAATTGTAASQGPIFKDCADCPEMVILPAGNFLMGSPASETGRQDNEGPQHRVSVRSFAAGKFEVSRGQFAAFVKDSGHNAGNECFTFEDGKYEKRSRRNWQNPGYSQTDSHPVVCVSWDDARAYLAWLSSKTGKTYRLLSEAEWEYGARAGSGTARSWGESPDQACGYGNIGDQATKSRVPGWTYEVHNCTDGHAYTAPGGSFKPNAFGLHDMIGNAWEWTEDCWNNTYSGAPGDGSAWTTEECSVVRVQRGGSWVNAPKFARSARRKGDDLTIRFSDYGFRLARTLGQEATQQIGATQRVEAGSEWAESDNGEDINWNEAKNYCASKGSGWRLPTVAELQSSHQSGQAMPCGATLFISNTCKVVSKSRLTGPWFWSNEPNGSSEGWTVTLINGSRFATDVEYRSKHRALCVRRP